MSLRTDAFALALHHHRAGDLPRAEHLYRHALQQDAAHADAWHGLGLLACQRGQPQAALPCLDRALALRPGYAEAHHNLGLVLKEQHRLGEAVAHLRQALRLRPDLVDAAANLGHALTRLGDVDEAVAVLQEALQRWPAGWQRWVREQGSAVG